MEALMTWAKENFDLICLLVGVIGVILAVISLFHELNERKRKKDELKNQIAAKEATLKAMKSSMEAGFNVQEYGSLNMQMSALQAEIEELKKQL